MTGGGGRHPGPNGDRCTVARSAIRSARRASFFGTARQSYPRCGMPFGTTVDTMPASSAS